MNSPLGLEPPKPPSLARLRLDRLPGPLRSRRNQVIAAVVVVLLVVGGVVLARVLRGDPGVPATADGYFSLACSLNDGARSDRAELDGVDGAASTRLMAESQLLGAAARTGKPDAALVDVGNALNLAVQRQDEAALPDLLAQVDDACAGKDRVDATADNEADLACSLRASLASSAATPDALGEPDGAAWAQLRALRALAAAAEDGDSDYSFLSDDATAAYLAAAKGSPSEYADGLATLDTDC